MKKTKLMMVLLFLSTGTVMAQQAKVTSLMSKDLTEMPGREVLMITVEYAPGGVDPIHRHNAHAFVYVLEGSIVMQVKGGKEVMLTPGQTFYEGPDDVRCAEQRTRRGHHFAVSRRQSGDNRFSSAPGTGRV